MGTLAEFERDLIRERTRAGMKAAKKRSKHVGRPKALSPTQVQHVRELLAAGKTQCEVAELREGGITTIQEAPLDERTDPNGTSLSNFSKKSGR